MDGWRVSENPRVLERIVEDGLLDGGEHEADVGGIGGLCQTGGGVSI
jgi:hypothetical protein